MLCPWFISIISTDFPANVEMISFLVLSYTGTYGFWNLQWLVWDSNLHNLVCSFKRVCRFLKLLSLPTIQLSFSLRCFVHDLYQSYPQIFQPTQKWFLSWFYRIQEHMERKFVWKTTLVLFHKQVCATGSANGGRLLKLLSNTLFCFFHLLSWPRFISFSTMQTIISWP